MQKKSQEDYRTAVADALIGHREDIRVHRNTLSDHAVTLDDHATSLADHATELDSHNTELVDHETRVDSLEAHMHYNPASCYDVYRDDHYVFAVGLDHHVYWKRYTTSWSGWTAVGGGGGDIHSGLGCHYSADTHFIHVFGQGPTGEIMHLYYDPGPGTWTWASLGGTLH